MRNRKPVAITIPELSANSLSPEKRRISYRHVEAATSLSVITNAENLWEFQLPVKWSNPFGAATQIRECVFDLSQAPLIRDVSYAQLRQVSQDKPGILSALGLVGREKGGRSEASR